MNSYLVLENGYKAPLSSYRNRVPIQAFMTTLHIDVCDRVASLMEFEEEEHKVFTNILIAHSRDVREITAALMLIKSGRIKATEIKCILGRDELKDLLPSGFIVGPAVKLDKPLFSRAYMRRFIAKIFFHKLYRLMPRKKHFSDFAIRSWVESSEQKFHSKYGQGTILIYPFYSNFKRHFDYIKHCYKTYDKIQIIGIPYSFLGLIKLLWQAKNRDKAIVLTEVAAYRKHAKEIKRYAQKALYTSDEFEGAALCLANDLRRMNSEVINSAHGLAFVCPYVNYSIFNVYNEAQLNYFSYKSPNTVFNITPMKNSSSKDFLKSARSFRPYIVLLHGNYSGPDAVYGRELESRAIKKLLQISASQNLHFCIKLHPNASVADKRHFKNDLGIELAETLEDLSAGNAIFVTLVTAAFYDFYHFAPFLFITENITALDYMYGFPVHEATLENMANHIRDMCIEDCWNEKLRIQIQKINQK